MEITDNKILKIASMTSLVGLASLLNSPEYQGYAKWINARIEKLYGDSNMDFIKDKEVTLW